jgi:geranylgeranyl diphosphate synthase, type I
VSPKGNKYLEEFLPLIEKEIKNVLEADKNDNLYSGMRYAIGHGKRVRPILCLAACKLLGGDVKKALPFAAVIETMHNFTLVHDDIEDGDAIRRNLPTVWKKFGLAHGINIGDGMIFKSYEYLFKALDMQAEEKLKLFNMLNTTLMEIVEGQAMEFDFREKDNVTIKEYEKMVCRKTGSLFALSLDGGAFIADCKKSQSALNKYGEKIGIAFQISDDILNLTSRQEKYGKSIGGDIKEGKRTLMTIHCLEKCDKNEKGKMLSILKRGRENVSDGDVNFVMSMVKKYGSIEFAKKFLEKTVEDAKKCLKGVESMELRNILGEFADFIIKREY